MSQEKESPSRTDVWKMFDRIAHKYDLLNRMLSLGRDTYWRKRAASFIDEQENLKVLDLATGTADIILSICEKCEKNTAVHYAAGIDLSPNMLNIGRKKIDAKALENTAVLLPGDVMDIPFRRGSFHAVTIAFGIRNVLNVNQALQEMFRVLGNRGRVIILEFSLPTNYILKHLYLLYFRTILPKIGSILSGDSHAYRYLNRTVETFPFGKSFIELLTEAGFRGVKAY
ncbi:bifunctional demethylmenaquinone methyltransferase/2-methoxy-6-polyprenyl-1,4-benzoquinol methylase UbiE, partial [candidate division KSB1 bacterium]